METRVIWTDDAADDFDVIHRFIQNQSPQLANKWLNTVFDKLELIEKFPEMGRIVPEKQVTFIREIFVGNYRLIYALLNDKINILAIKHFSSNLGKL